MKKGILLSALLISMLTLSGQDNSGVVFSNSNYFEVLQQAENEGKSIFIEFGVNCGYCIKMKREVFVDPQVGEFYNANFVNIEIDESSKIGRDIGERYNIYSYPTYFYLNSKGEIVHIAANYKSPEKIIKVGQQALDKKVHSPTGVWWNKLKTRSKSTYTLFNTANSAFLSLTGYSDDFSNKEVSLSSFNSVSETQISNAKDLIMQSLDIEEYYFNTFVASIVFYLSNDLENAQKYAEMALSNFPHHMEFMRTRDQILNEIIAKSKS